MNMEYNEKGFAFVPNLELTKYLQEEHVSYTSTQKGLPKNFIILDIYHKEHGFCSRLLFDTNTQNAIEELSTGLEQCYCKIDIIRIKYNEDLIEE